MVPSGKAASASNRLPQPRPEYQLQLFHAHRATLVGHPLRPTRCHATEYPSQFGHRGDDANTICRGAPHAYDIEGMGPTQDPLSERLALRGVAMDFLQHVIMLATFRKASARM